MSEATKENTLQDKALQERRRYYREYRRRNSDKVREWNRNYWRRKAERLKGNADHDQ